ncbi:unnamed protein product [Ranitomeya imitator]|uniref:UBC core domain-containing protein n=1 Tax=Ranitomeya imitator TaxID=111125 RepID=A0ABN9KUG0_9NEOB|nr:unnamed protein product [Ranitomeya imitator]
MLIVDTHGNQGQKHRVTKRGPALSYPMFTLVTSEDIAGSPFKFISVLNCLNEDQVTELNKNPVEGFSAGLIDDNDLYRWEVLIIGPPDTLYEGGVFKAHLTFPRDYPLRPPKMKFITEIWHPNVDKNGDVCISILHEPGEDKYGYEKPEERWLPIHTVETIMISVISMLADPNGDSPANVDAAGGGHNCFPLEDTDGLIKAVRSTMGLVDSHPKKTVQDIMFGGLEQKKRRAFPLNEAIAALIKKEWKKPMRKTLLTPKRKYPFEEESCSFWEKAPKLDVAIAKASKKFALPFEDMGVLKDPMDKKADAFLKGSWEAAGGGLKPAVAAACTSRSLMIWLNQLEGQLKGKTSRDSILNTLPVMRGAAAFLADSSADSIRLSARAAVFANAARRALWLKNWPGDLQTKTKLCTIPCEGEFLFGSTLDDILEKAGDKRKSFPLSGSSLL